MSLEEKMLIMLGTFWLTTIAFVIYLWFLQAKQQMILRYIAKKLSEIESIVKKTKKTTVLEKSTTEDGVEPEIKKTETVVTISKNEPMSKYETVNLPDEAEIKFVD